MQTHHSKTSEKTKIAGTFTATYMKQEKIEIEDTEGHFVSLSQAEGTNENTGEHTHMDGARVLNVAFNDLIKGNGHHQGYNTFIHNGNTTLTKWEGTVTTRLSTEGAPIITFEGTYIYLKGTGQFENIQGKGTYKGRFISETTYIAEWEGKYFIKE